MPSNASDDASSTSGTVTGWSYAPSTITESETTARPKPRRDPTPKPTQAPVLSLPPPPSPKTPWNPEISKMTTLTNFLQRTQRTEAMQMQTTNAGEPHLPTWTLVCIIDGKVYGRSSNSKTKVAQEEAASQALEKIYAEDPDAVMKTLSYLPRFKTYLQNNNITHRFQWNFSKEGQCHDLTWKCTVVCDGRKLAEGTASSKNASEEQAARKAALALLSA